MNTNFKIRTLLRRHLRWYGDPPRERATASLDRVWERLQPHAHSAPRLPVDSLETESRRAAGTPWRLRVAAATLVWRPADDTLFRVVEGRVQMGDTPSLLRSFGGTGTIRSNGGTGVVLALLDGSRIEMRTRSELSLERADDGVRIRLHSGGIIVNAAKQRTGHLYVQTKDVTVSVVGTVFLVNAEEHGSRVAVIEGEVRVLQGTNEKRLRPGEQVTSSPAMAAPPVRQVIAWSRNAPHSMRCCPRPHPSHQSSRPSPRLWVRNSR